MHVPMGLNEIVDVVFGADRVWSFDPGRERWPVNRGWVAWPRVLDGLLEGIADVRLVLHEGGKVVFERRVSFGDGGGGLHLVDHSGEALAVDKSGHLVRTFANTGREQTDGLLDSVEAVLRDLREHCAVDAFLTFGCLLGAVREGRVIGHDGDADVSYLSRHTHPFDIIRENQQVCSTMRSLGWSIVRMSAADFKIWVRPAEGANRIGIDVFTSFYAAGSFYMMPTVTGDLSRSSILPLGQVTLEGRQLAAPAEPEALLEVAYGPGWRVPDPVFDIESSRATYRRISGWMRTNKKYIKHWNDFYRAPASARVPRLPSSFASWVGDRLPPHRHILDVGCGNGRDSVFFAERGHRVTALDASTPALLKTRRLARERAVRLRPLQLNLNDLSSTLLSGARFAHLKKPPEIYARFLLDAIAPDARDNFFRWAQMIQRRGGSTYLEFRTWPGAIRASTLRFHYRALLDTRSVIAEIEGHGGSVVHREQGTARARFEGENPHVCRLIVRWA
ncbi:MAG TPA: class I SAM-dependent methyltransferase [Nocardioidaceae bacterium]|nr:class I SAM-dependent methyltransferase [Nocardioidaceae bacterium]